MRARTHSRRTAEQSRQCERVMAGRRVKEVQETTVIVLSSSSSSSSNSSSDTEDDDLVLPPIGTAGAAAAAAVPVATASAAAGRPGLLAESVRLAAEAEGRARENALKREKTLQWMRERADEIASLRQRADDNLAWLQQRETEAEGREKRLRAAKEAWANGAEAEGDDLIFVDAKPGGALFKHTDKCVAWFKGALNSLEVTAQPTQFDVLDAYNLLRDRLDLPMLKGQDSTQVFKTLERRMAEFVAEYGVCPICDTGFCFSHAMQFLYFMSVEYRTAGEKASHCCAMVEQG